MTFVFDHMIAILVGATLLAGLFMLQVRGQQTAIEAAQRYRVQTQTSGFAQTVERDVENIRTQAQSQAAFGNSALGGYRFTLRQAPGGAYTEQATFVTLKDPSLGPDSPAIVVSYTTEPTGQTVEVGGVARPTYRVLRQIGERGDTVLRPDGGGEGLLDFDLTALMNDGLEQTWGGGTRHPTSGIFNAEIPMPRAVRVEIVGATDAVRQRAADQRNTAEINASRQTRTVALVAYGASGGLPPVDTSEQAVMPPLPGDPPPPPPPPTTTGGGDDDDDDDDDTITPGGGGGGGTNNPLPPRPTTGREI